MVLLLMMMLLVTRMLMTSDAGDSCAIFSLDSLPDNNRSLLYVLHKLPNVGVDHVSFGESSLPGSGLVRTVDHERGRGRCAGPARLLQSHVRVVVAADHEHRGRRLFERPQHLRQHQRRQRQWWLDDLSKAGRQLQAGHQARAGGRVRAADAESPEHQRPLRSGLQPRHSHSGQSRSCPTTTTTASPTKASFLSFLKFCSNG